MVSWRPCHIFRYTLWLMLCAWGTSAHFCDDIMPPWSRPHHVVALEKLSLVAVLVFRKVMSAGVFWRLKVAKNAYFYSFFIDFYFLRTDVNMLQIVQFYRTFHGLSFCYFGKVFWVNFVEFLKAKILVIEAKKWNFVSLLEPLKRRLSKIFRTWKRSSEIDPLNAERINSIHPYNCEV